MSEPPYPEAPLASRRAEPEENRETRWPSDDYGSVEPVSTIGEHLAEARAVEEHQERKHAERDEWRGVYPGYCIDPETCRGYSHCPRNYSCVE